MILHFLREEEGIQKYQSLIGQLRWAILLGRFNIAVVIMTMMSAFRSAPRKGNLDQFKRIYGCLSKMRYSAIQICTEEPHSSDILRTEYDWEFSVYRGAKEELWRMRPSHWADIMDYYWIQMDGNVSIVSRREPRRRCYLW
jgi:hypothetical protein